VCNISTGRAGLLTCRAIFSFFLHHASYFSPCAFRRPDRANDLPRLGPVWPACGASSPVRAVTGLFSPLLPFDTHSGCCPSADRPAALTLAFTPQRSAFSCFCIVEPIQRVRASEGVSQAALNDDFHHLGSFGPSLAFRCCLHTRKSRRSAPLCCMVMAAQDSARSPVPARAIFR
jgi:hypothetical protein